MSGVRSVRYPADHDPVPSCGTANLEGATFCAACGTALGTDPSPGAPTREVRKLVTVLFADVVGSDEPRGDSSIPRSSAP